MNFEFNFQLYFRNVSLHTQLCLQEFNTTNKLPNQKHVGGPSFNLLLRFQRLLVAKIYMKDHNCLKAAESLLQKYLHELTTHATDTINYAYEIAITNPKNFVCILEVLKGDIVGKQFLRLAQSNRLSNRLLKN